MSATGRAETLTRALDRFSVASASLERTHALLRHHVERLEGELRSAQERLTLEHAERRRTDACLSGVLESLACGVLVIAPGPDVSCRRVTMANPAAGRILGGEGDPAGRPVGELPKVVREALNALEGGGAAARTRADCAGLKVEAAASRIPETSGGALGDVVVLYDVTAVHRLEEVAGRRSRLEAMGRLAAEIAHEIRNPLGSLDLTAGLLRDALAGSPEHRDLVDQILLGVQMLNAAVVKALSLARPVTARLERVDVAALTREVIAYLEPVARARGVLLSPAIGGSSWIDADRELFRQLALNLIHNALEAAGRDGVVTVRLRPREERPLLTIADNGPGIPPEDRARIFEPLFTRKTNGTGLGLAVVQRAADEHGWGLRVRSAPGKGTTITVGLFPRRRRSPGRGREKQDACIRSRR